MKINDKTLQRIDRALGRDGVWVAPGLRKKIPLRVERKVARAIDGAKPKIYAVLVKLPVRDKPYKGSLEKLIKDVRPKAGNAMYIGVDKNLSLDVISGGKEGGQTAFFAREAARKKHPDDIAAQVLGASRLLSKGDARSAYKKLNKPSPSENGTREQGVGKVEAPEASPSASAPTSSTASTASTDDNEAGGPWVVIGIGVVLALVVVAVLVALLLRRRKGGPISDTDAPAPVIALSHAMRRRRHRRRARRDVATLGRQLAETTAPAESEARRDAVEHHTVAQRIIAGPHSQADAVGVIVLAMRGADALEAANAGRSWKPTATCYLNPLHGWSDRHVSWRGAAGGLEPPACKDCADTIETGRMPDDVLDFMHGGRPRHYFALVLEPWSSTGFGSLETDLLPLLQTRPY